MSSSRDIDANFFFLEGTRGQLFATLRTPTDRQCIGAVLCVLPLMEEANRCRRLVAVQSSSLAEQGFAVLCVDPYGSGDSAGEFSEADWNLWIDDLRIARDWLSGEYGSSLYIWAIRQGALLAGAAFGGEHQHQMILWHPVVSGESALVEMLRVSVASNMLSGSESRTTVGALKNNLLSGEATDVGGYPISPAFARSLGSASMNPWPFSSIVDWIDVMPEGSEAGSARRDVDMSQFDFSGCELRHHTVEGRRFWSSPDVFECDELIEKTLQILLQGAHVS